MSLEETRRRGDLPAPLAVFARVLDVLAGVTIALAGTALVALVVMMGWLVFGRYVLNDTPTWIERGATLAILCIAMPRPKAPTSASQPRAIQRCKAPGRASRKPSTER